MTFLVSMRRIGRARFLAGALLLLAGVPGSGQEPPLDVPAARADELVRAAIAESRLPSLSVAVARDGAIVYAAAQGLADVEHSVPASPRSVYRLGSITKVFTAAAALALAEDGELDLDAPVARTCPAFPAKPHEITVRQLLGHLGGVRHYDYRRFEEDFLNRTRFESLEAALAKFAGDPLVAAPGTKFHYSSWGYVWVGCALEGAAGRPYGELLRETVLGPAGLTATTLDRPAEIVPHRARGYSRAEDGSWQNAVYFDASDRYPAGGLLGTPSEVARFAAELLAGRVLSPSSLERMLAPQKTLAGEETGAGLGWSLSDDRREAFHGGTSVGASSFLYLLPEERLAVVLATNLSLWTDPRLDLARALARLFTASR